MRLLYRPAEAAAAVGVSRSRMYELIASGEVPSVRVGGTLRVPVDALAALGETAGRRVEDATSDDPVMKGQGWLPGAHRPRGE